MASDNTSTTTQVSTSAETEPITTLPTTISTLSELIFFPTATEEPSLSTSTKNNSIYSHHFDITEDADSKIEIINNDGQEINNDNTVYKLVTSNPTTTKQELSFDDLNITRNEISNNLTIPKFRSDLYDVVVNENVTEVITIGLVTELERRPRDNDQLEPLDGAYKKLEAQYGGWENGAADKNIFCPLLFTVVVTCALLSSLLVSDSPNYLS